MGNHAAGGGYFYTYYSNYTLKYKYAALSVCLCRSVSLCAYVNVLLTALSLFWKLKSALTIIYLIFGSLLTTVHSLSLYQGFN